MKEKIGIVTVLYKSESVLTDFFISLNKQTYKNITLYIIDNDSPDNSLALSEELSKHCFFETKFVCNNANGGVAQGNNQGIIYALYDNCDYILLSNNDVVLQENTIKNLYEGLLLTSADLAIPKIFYYDINKIWAAGGKMNKLNARAIHYGSLQDDDDNYSISKQVSYSPTCFMLIHKTVFIDVGLMDEKYFVYYDDVDFIYRTQGCKKKLFYIANTSLKHKESVSTGVRSNFSLYYNYRNRIYFLSKFKLMWEYFFVLDIIYHHTIRKYTMRKCVDQWKVCEKGIIDGYKMAKGYIFKEPMVNVL